jgi:hypothetical protein
MTVHLVSSSVAAELTEAMIKSFREQQSSRKSFPERMHAGSGRRQASSPLVS